jgi:hypothetical protein
VIAEVEVRVVDPARACLDVGHEREPLAVARNEVEAALDDLEQIVVGRRTAVEQHQSGHVHVRRPALEVEEGVVEGGQPVFGHWRCAHVEGVCSNEIYPSDGSSTRGFCHRRPVLRCRGRLTPTTCRAAGLDQPVGGGTTAATPGGGGESVGNPTVARPNWRMREPDS